RCRRYDPGGPRLGSRAMSRAGWRADRRRRGVRGSPCLRSAHAVSALSTESGVRRNARRDCPAQPAATGSALEVPRAPRACHRATGRGSRRRRAMRALSRRPASARLRANRRDHLSPFNTATLTKEEGMDPNAKKTALRMIPYGLYVLTAANKEGKVAAATVNWVTQASFEPPLVVVGVKADSGGH